jgi:hypothetical protein
MVNSRRDSENGGLRLVDNIIPFHGFVQSQFNNSFIRPGTALLSDACYTNLALLGGVFMMDERLYGNEREVINH